MAITTTFKCPQCVAASLTSKVAFVIPVKDCNQNLIWFDTSGNVHQDNTLGDLVIYLCTNNHMGHIAKPTGF